MSSSVKTVKIKEKPTSYKGIWDDNGIRSHLQNLSRSGKASKVIDKDYVKPKEEVKEIPFKFDEEFCQKVLNKFPDSKEVEEALENNNINTIDFFINERLDARNRLDIYIIKSEYLDRGLQGFKDLQKYINTLEENFILKEEFNEIIRNKNAKEKPIIEDSYEEFKKNIEHYANNIHTYPWSISQESGNTTVYSSTMGSINSIITEAPILTNDNPQPVTEL